MNILYGFEYNRSDPLRICLIEAKLCNSNKINTLQTYNVRMYTYIHPNRLSFYPTKVTYHVELL